MHSIVKLHLNMCIIHASCSSRLTLAHTHYHRRNLQWVNQLSGSKRREVMKTDNFYYVSLLDSLASQLNLEDFQVEVLNTHGTSAMAYCSNTASCDGLLFKQSLVLYTMCHFMMSQKSNRFIHQKAQARVHHLKVWIMSFVVDFIASHLVGGFKQTMSFAFQHMQRVYDNPRVVTEVFLFGK